eukprot:tig00021432_g21237.t1
MTAFSFSPVTAKPTSAITAEAFLKPAGLSSRRALVARAQPRFTARTFEAAPAPSRRFFVVASEEQEKPEVPAAGGDKKKDIYMSDEEMDTPKYVATPRQRKMLRDEVANPYRQNWFFLISVGIAILAILSYVTGAI